MILPTIYPSIARLRHLNLPLALFWSAYFALWPGVLWWWSRL